MRFAYVAAGAVVLGAVSEAGSVPSSPQRMDKVVKRQSAQLTPRLPLEPLKFGYPTVAKAKKAGPSRLHDEALDAYDDVGMSKNANMADAQRQATEFVEPAEFQNPDSLASASMLGYGSAPELAAEAKRTIDGYIIGAIPTDRPENVAKKVVGSLGVGPFYKVVSAEKNLQPTSLDGPVYMVENESGRPEDIYTGAPSQIQSATRTLPTDYPADTLLEAYLIASGRSIPPSATLPSTVPPASPLFRALSDVNSTVHPSETIIPSENNTTTSETKKELPVPANNTLLSPQGPLPISRTVQMPSGSRNDTSLPTPASALAPTSLPIPAPLPSDGTSLSPNVNSTVENSERETLFTPTGSNITIGSPLMGSNDGSMASNTNATNQLAGPSSNVPLNTTDTSMAPLPLSPPSKIPNAE